MAVAEGRLGAPGGDDVTRPGGVENRLEPPMKGPLLPLPAWNPLAGVLLLLEGPPGAGDVRPDPEKRNQKLNVKFFVEIINFYHKKAF